MPVFRIPLKLRDARFPGILPLVALAALAAGLGAPPEARAVDLRAARHWSAPDHTRLVIDLDGSASFTHRTLESPPRIAIDVEGGRFRFPLEPLVIRDGLVERVRFNKLGQSGKAQIVLDLKHAARYDVFALDPYGSKPNRIVVDVHRPARARPSPPPRPRTLTEQRIGPESFGDFLVIIDPGHGGEDPGRRNPDGTEEKHLTLEFARNLKQAIDAAPGYRAELTRDGDYFVSLRRRREIAEEKNAHLFVSLHFNAAPARSARGTEVFFVSLKGAEGRAVEELVEAENSADLVGGLPPSSDETRDNLTKMLVNLRQADSVARSQGLALSLTDHVSKVNGISIRPVRQAGFAVLKSLFMPAVLVEVAFLSNRDDLRFVKARRNRERYVRALADGIMSYCEEVEIPRLGWSLYTVRPGDSLSKIASVHSMSVDSLRDANDLADDRIRIGQKLRVRPR